VSYNHSNASMNATSSNLSSIELPLYRWIAIQNHEF
jgi:hypothetical protein